jgi:hypothetical protein
MGAVVHWPDSYPMTWSTECLLIFLRQYQVKFLRCARNYQLRLVCNGGHRNLGWSHCGADWFFWLTRSSIIRRLRNRKVNQCSVNNSVNEKYVHRNAFLFGGKHAFSESVLRYYCIKGRDSKLLYPIFLVLSHMLGYLEQKLLDRLQNSLVFLKSNFFGSDKFQVIRSIW